MHSLNNNVTYFVSSCVEHIPKEIKRFIGNRNIQTIFFRIQAYDSVMCGYFWIGFIDFMFKGKSPTDFTNLFSLFFLKNDDIVVNFFMANASKWFNAIQLKHLIVSSFKLSTTV